MSNIGEISPQALKDRLDRGDRLVILDVRDHAEVALAPFPGAIHIPMEEITSRLHELDPDVETVVVCHHGLRSAQVGLYLANLGFEKVLNLSGGIDGWSRYVDPSVPRY